MSMMPPPQPGGMVFVQAVPRTDIPPGSHYSTPARIKAIARMSIIQIVIGCLCIIFQTALVITYALSRTRHGGIAAVYDGIIAPGIWCGAYYIICGSIGLLSSKKNSPCPIIAFLVLNIIGVVLAVIAHLQYSVAALILNVSSHIRCRNYTGPSCDSYGSCYDSGGCSTSNHPLDDKSAFIALDVILVLGAFTQFITALTCSIMGCIATCCRPRPAPSQMYYAPQGVQAVPGVSPGASPLMMNKA